MSEFYYDTDDVSQKMDYTDEFGTLPARVKLLYTYTMRDDRVMMLALFRQLTATDCERMVPLHREAIGYLLQSTFRGEIEWLAELVDMWRRGDFDSALALLNIRTKELDSTAVTLLLSVRSRCCQRL